MFCIKRIGAITLLTLMTISCLAPFVGKIDNYEIVAATTQDNYEQSNNQIIEIGVYRAFIDQIDSESKTQDIFEVIKYIDMNTPSENSFKSYMDYRTIKDKSSQQYYLQQYAITDETGIRMIHDRFCIAVGSGYCVEIGTYIDIVMENGSIIECIMADAKADKDTDANTHRQNKNGSIVEFIVDKNQLSNLARISGDISNSFNELKGEIAYIRVYREAEEGDIIESN